MERWMCSSDNISLWQCHRQAIVSASLAQPALGSTETESCFTSISLPRPQQITKQDLTPKDTVDESQTGSFLQGVNWRAGTDDGPGPKPLTHR